MSQRDEIRKALARWRDAHNMRQSWHEPDEQGITAEIAGNHLDNAMGEMGDNIGSHGELTVMLADEEGETLKINLASLLAAAAEGVDLGGTEGAATANAQAEREETMRTQVTRRMETPTDPGPVWTLEQAIPVETATRTDGHHSPSHSESIEVVERVMWVWRRKL